MLRISNAIIEGYEEKYGRWIFTVKVLFGAKKSVNINLLPERRLLRMCLSTSQRIQPASSTVLLTRFLNEDGTVSTAIELEEGDQVKVWGYASQYLELQEGLKIVVVQPGIIERNGELVILDKNLKAD